MSKKLNERYRPLMILLIIIIVNFLAFKFGYLLEPYFGFMNKQIKILDEPISMTPFQFEYEGSYTDTVGNVLKLKYVKDIEGYKVYCDISIFNDRLFMKEERYSYKANYNAVDLILMLDGKKGEEVKLIDGQNIYYFKRESTP